MQPTLSQPSDLQQQLAAARQSFPKADCHLDEDGLVIQRGRCGLRLNCSEDGVWSLRVPGDAMTFQGYSIDQAVREARTTYAKRLEALQRLESSWPSSL
jgi:hypothetical protein